MWYKSCSRFNKCPGWLANELWLMAARLRVVIVLVVVVVTPAAVAGLACAALAAVII